MNPDDRVPLRFGALTEATPQDALLLDLSVPEAASYPEAASVGARAVARFGGGAMHRLGCACCGGARAPAAVALAGLFQARATGAVPWFSRVLAVVGDAGSVADELRADRVAAARFRIGS